MNWLVETNNAGRSGFSQGIRKFSSMKEDKAINKSSQGTLIIRSKSMSFIFMAFNDLGRKQKEDSQVTCCCESNIKAQHDE